MPTGQLLFSTATQCWAETIGQDQYAIIKAIPGQQSTTPNSQFIALYVGTGTVRSLGGFDQFNAAVNACQTDFNGLAT